MESNETSNQDQQLLRIEEVARIFQVAPRTVRQWKLAGKLKGVHLGPRKLLRFRKEDVDAFIAQQTTK